MVRNVKSKPYTHVSLLLSGGGGCCCPGLVVVHEFLYKIYTLVPINMHDLINFELNLPEFYLTRERSLTLV